ncbi:MAG: hypothetical protein AAGE92_09565 [Cyanobacteria bacterium P01_G01_bin.4]
MVLSVAVAVMINRCWQLGMVATLVLLSTGLWAILDGMWQPSYAFSVVEPSLLVVVLAVFVLTAVTGQWQLTGGAIASFVASGAIVTAFALQSSSSPSALLQEATRSGCPMILGGLVAISIVLVGRQWGWGGPIAFCAALAVGLILDSSLYTALVQQQVIGQQVDWVQPLVTKVADKLLLALIAVATIWRLGALPKQLTERT